jgi:hypothetical protein
VCRFLLSPGVYVRVCEKCQEQWPQISYRRRCARAAGGAWKTRSAECARVEFRRRRKSRSHTARRKWLIAAAAAARYLSRRRRVFRRILSIRSRSVADILENNIHHGVWYITLYLIIILCTTKHVALSAAHAYWETKWLRQNIKQKKKCTAPKRSKILLQYTIYRYITWSISLQVLQSNGNIFSLGKWLLSKR